MCLGWCLLGNHARKMPPVNLLPLFGRDPEFAGIRLATGPGVHDEWGLGSSSTLACCLLSFLVRPPAPRVASSGPAFNPTMTATRPQPRPSFPRLDLLLVNFDLHDLRFCVQFLFSPKFLREPQSFPPSCFLFVPPATDGFSCSRSTSSGCSASAFLFLSPTLLPALPLQLQLWCGTFSPSSSIPSVVTACSYSPSSGADFVLFVPLSAACPSSPSFASLLRPY